MNQDVPARDASIPATSEASAGAVAVADDGAELIRRYEERLARDPASLAWAPLADAHRKAGRPRQAIELCRDGLRRAPHYHTARLILAKALLDEGDGEAALAELTAALDAGARDPGAHRLASEIHRKAGRLEPAAAHLAEAARLDPEDREARLALDSLRAAGRVPEGSALAGLLADDTFATLAFGALCLEQGLAEEAAQIFLRLLGHDPGNARAREGLDQALRVKTQRRKGP